MHCVLLYSLFYSDGKNKRPRHIFWFDNFFTKFLIKFFLQILFAENENWSNKNMQFCHPSNTK